MNAHSKVAQFVLLFAVLTVTLATSVRAEVIPPSQRPASASGDVVVPDRFLRRWDPVTVFFSRDIGPVTPGPEDKPERLVTFAPAHPGAFTWVDARTLQFRPADPWPPLTRFIWTVEGKSRPLVTLMAAPVAMSPNNNAENLDEVETISLTFPEPLEVSALSRMVTIELRPLPGIGQATGRFLKESEYSIKVVERTAPNDQASYIISLNSPIPLSTRAFVRLRLSLDDDPRLSFTEMTFATAEPFRVESVGCSGRTFPITPDGTRYAEEQAARCSTNDRRLLVTFSAQPQGLGAVEARNLVRLTPTVDNLKYAANGRSLEISGNFLAETLYRVTLTRTPITDNQGRSLEMRGESELFVVFPRKSAYLKLGAGQGIVERFGPQLAPFEGRGDERVDLRIYRINSLDRSFWPFPKEALNVDESERPPGPGEEPAPFTRGDRYIGEYELVEQIRNLQTPMVSALVKVPLLKEGNAASFGFDLEPYLTAANGKGQPGQYIVGMRRLDASDQRSWMRMQVTDLALATMEEPQAVRFVVTSLSNGSPVIGARVVVEASTGNTWTRAELGKLFDGTTDAQGAVTWTPPINGTGATVHRIYVQKDNDVLVQNPHRAPDFYRDGRWGPTRESWLQWTGGFLSGRGKQAENLAHIFTERPVYRPEETVHIKGYLRLRKLGKLVPIRSSGELVVQGPGDLVWRFPMEVSPTGSFYHAFSAEQLPTGVYFAYYEDGNGRYGRVSFRMEAYRIPEFEVQLLGPQRAPLDKEFEMNLIATYYAGGRAASRPVRWRVTQFPYAWTPKGREGFRFSSDSRYSGDERFASTGILEKDDTTDGEGSVRLVINPAIEVTAQPRTYVVEATVTGADDQTVTNVQQVLALPPFVLGLKAPRFLEKAVKIEPEIIVLGPDDKPLAGQSITVRLLHRQWHSVLQASDFSQGQARYVTDIVDDKVFETIVKSAPEAMTVPIPISKAGVYIIEVESADRLGRSQKVSVDLYAGGEDALSWAKPTTQVFTVSADKKTYNPGDTANLVLQSPFQKAMALCVIEAPEGNQYTWLPVEGGAATFKVPVIGTYTPSIPVHFVLMRGRIAGTTPAPGSNQDVGKPATMAATCWVTVNPLDNRVEVKVENPEKALPSTTVNVTVRLSDPQGRPLPGEVTLWLVDQAVLALGKEQRLDPLPDFITDNIAYLVVRDTRNQAWGLLPFAELPGGDQGEKGGLLDRTTVRKNFKSVPYFNPAITVGLDGVVTVAVQLPDNLTNFKIRAKATSGPERFGYGVSQIAVRLPVIVQPALPRFVRPGDSFTAAAVGRVVEGEGGPGKAEIQVEGVDLKVPATQTLTFVPNQPQRLDFPVDVPTPKLNDKGELSRKEVLFRVGVERSADKARDAFEVKLPIRDDRRRVNIRLMKELEAGKPLVIPALPEAARPGTVRRSLLVSDQPGLVRMAAGLNFLLTYPYGCTEQRVSCARAQLALRKFRDLLQQTGDDKQLDRAVKDTLEWVSRNVDATGLVAYWPGSEGYVSLTAWVVQFLVEAKEAGFAVDEKLLGTLIGSLEQALRSDYSRFIDGASFAERCWALVALAQAGKFNPAYAAELARKAQFLNLESVAAVLMGFARGGDATSGTAKELAQRLWDGLVIRLYQGKEIYGGLQETASAYNTRILSCETRTVAELTRALARTNAARPRVQVLIDALVTLGRDDGWGTTNANASALLALSELLQPPFTGSTAHTVRLRLGGAEKSVSIGVETPVGTLISADSGAGEVILQSGGSGTVVARVESSFVPLADGSKIEPVSEGFVVVREAMRQKGTGIPAERIAINAGATKIAYTVGDVIEEHAQIVNPADRFYVAIVLPLAAGMEPLNPALATAPPEAKSTGTLTLAPTYVAFLDDTVAFYYNTLPKGTYDFYFRTRATIPGSYSQPAATAELMYDGSVYGNSAGARVEIAKKP